jgi:hypothetical protein
MMHLQQRPQVDHTSRNQYTKEYGKRLTTPPDLLDTTHPLLFNYSI